MALTTRVVLNRKAFAQLDVAIADGLFALAERVLQVVDVPDAPPHGQGLIQGGGAVAYVGGKKVNGTTIGGRQVTKPRDRLQRDEIVAYVGFGFPARLVERGTVDTPKQPFLTSAVLSLTGESDGIIAAAAREKVAESPL